MAKLFRSATLVLLLASTSLPPACATAPQPANWVVLFQDDFETAANSWQVLGASDPGASWQRVKDGSNTVYSGQGHIWLSMAGQQWSDFRFSSRIKLLDGAVSVSYRTSACSRYFLYCEDTHPMKGLRTYTMVHLEVGKVAL